MDQLFQLSFDFGRAQALGDDLAALIDEQHRGNREDSKLVGRRAIQPPLFVDLRPRQLGFRQIGRKILAFVIQADADYRETGGDRTWRKAP